MRIDAPGGPAAVAEAIARAAPGDEILVPPRIFHEHDLLIDKPLTLTGSPGATIDGDNEGAILTIRADGVTVRGLTLRNVGVSYTKEHAAILLHRARHFRIENNRLENVFFGVHVEKSHHGLIADNDISSQAREEAYAGNGIHMWHCSNIEVRGNTLSGLRDGIYLEFVDDSLIHGNRSHDNLRYGLHFMFSNRDTYQHNEFTRNGAGVAVMFSRDLRMIENRFTHNWGSASYGLLLKEIYDAEVTGNRFEQNTIGINIDSATRIRYIGNVFHRNGWAVKVLGATYSNTFTENDFLANAFDLAYAGHLNDNRFSGNYWSAYSGYDLDRDGIGDVPFRPVKLFAYVVNRTPEALVLLRSLFIDLLNFSEKVSPVFTPDNLVDPQPRMRPLHD
ncbi:MAG: nitrous oxide reductase family maturation protein NosD [Verrucomicrobia bacterium]|nr:MAG: nitrous oxide reductase family maturation protein NosD [Verrucomicrobiota bacterium]